MADLNQINSIRTGQGLKPYTANQYANVQAKKYTDAELYEYAHYGTGRVAADAYPATTSSSQAAQAAQATQSAQAVKPAQQTTQSQPVQQSAPINPKSGLPTGQTFRYQMSHAQQNKFVRENDTMKAQGQTPLTELQFRRNIGMNTEVVGGSYTAPRVTNNSSSAGGTGDSQKVLSTKNTPNPVTKSNSKVDSQAKGVNNSVTTVSKTDVQRKQEEAAKAKEKAAKEAADKAKAAAAAKKAAEQEAAAKAKEAARLAAEARRTANEKAKAAAEKAAKEAAVKAENAKKAAKAAKEAAQATSDDAKAKGKSAYFSKLANTTGSTEAARKAAEAAKAVKATSAKADKANTKAEKLGIVNRPGQILLKDGTWIDQVQITGNRGKGNVVLYGSRSERDNVVTAQRESSRKAKEAIDRYKVVVDKNGKILDAVQANGKFGTGAGAVQVVTRDTTGNVVTASNTAASYRAKLRASVKNASIPITSETSSKDKKIIIDARNYILTRETGKVREDQAKNFLAIDKAYAKKVTALDKVSKSASGISISVNDKGKIFIDRKGKENKNAKVTYNAGKVIASTPAAIRNMTNDANKSYSRALAPVFTRLDKVDSVIDNVLANTDISINDKGRIYIDKKGRGKKGTVTFTASNAVKSANDNAVIGGVTGYAKDAYNYARYKPFSAAIGIGSTAVGGAAIGAGSKVLGAGLGMGLRGASTLAGTGKVASKLYASSAYAEQLVNAGLIGKLTVDIGETVKDRDYKALTGTIVNLAIGGYGFTKGQSAGLRGVDVARTIGKKEVPASSVIMPEILSGKAQIPTTKHGTPVSEMIKSFRDPVTGENIGYHTSPVQIFGKTKSKVGRKLDQPGLYVSPLKSGPSMHFSRIQSKDVKPDGVIESLTKDMDALTSAAGKVKASDLKVTASAIVSKVTGKTGNVPETVINLKSAVKSTPKNIVDSVLGTPTPLPVVNKIHLNRVERVQKDIRYDLKATQKAMDSAKPGKAFVTYKFEKNILKGNAETEATIVPNTVLKKLKSDRYFMYNGRVVTITEYKALEATGKIRKGEMIKRELTSKQKVELMKRYKNRINRGSVTRKNVKESRVSTLKNGIKAPMSSRVSIPKSGAKVSVSGYRASSGKSYNAKSAIRDRETTYKTHVSGYKSPVKSSVRATTVKSSTSRVSRRPVKASDVRGSGPSRKRETPVNRITPSRSVRTPTQTRQVRAPTQTRTPSRTTEPAKPTYSPTRKTPLKVPGSGRAPNEFKRPNIKTTDPVTKRKKKVEKVIDLTNVRSSLKMKRTIHNQLGGMESLFGSSTKRKTTKRKVKR